MTIIDTPEGIAAFGWLQVIHGLALEINTGMKLSRGGNLMTVLVRRGYTGPERGTKKNKGLALRWAIEQLQVIDPTFTPRTTVVRALEETA
jgi:hypothetical protein